MHTQTAPTIDLIERYRTSLSIEPLLNDNTIVEESETSIVAPASPTTKETPALATESMTDKQAKGISKEFNSGILKKVKKPLAVVN
jgi:hypothetical protein